MRALLLNLLWPLAAALATLAVLGSATLLVLSLAAARRRPARRASMEPVAPMLSLAIVVPAHNEACGIARTLNNLLPLTQADGASTVVVVADNCSDDTAAVAHACGARVLQRQDPDRRGKGCALDFAFHALATEGFDAYLVIDADSLVSASLLPAVRAQLEAGAAAVQARYTVLQDHGAAPTLAQLALFAFNVLRPRGRAALGLSAGILGNGFALRQAVLERVPYSATSVVEDLEYHLHLIEAGERVVFADDGEVWGEMPERAEAQASQRTRWEGGRLRMLREHGAPLLARVLCGQWRLLEPLLDLLLPPLAYHALLLLALLAMPWGWARAVALGGLAVLVLHVLCAARLGGIGWRGLARVALRVPAYLWWKLRLVRDLWRASSPRMAWVRTGRNIDSQQP